MSCIIERGRLSRQLKKTGRGKMPRVRTAFYKNSKSKAVEGGMTKPGHPESAALFGIRVLTANV